MEDLLKTVAEQATDPGLFFEPENVTEAYFQHELRRLHDKIRNLTPEIP